MSNHNQPSSLGPQAPTLPSLSPPPQRIIQAIYQQGRLVPQEALDLPEGMPIAVQLALHINSALTQAANQAWQFVPQLETRTVEAVCEQGAIRLLAPADLPEGTPIRLSAIWRLEMLATPGGEHAAALPLQPPAQSFSAQPAVEVSPPLRGRRLQLSKRLGILQTQALWNKLPAARMALARPLGQASLLALLSWLDLLLLSAAMLVYALVRYIGLERFPIYFFADEAIQTNLGRDLLQNGLRDSQGVFLPPYFRNVDKWSLSLTVYIQAISSAVFGSSVAVNRATAATVTLLAGIAVALTLRLVFRLRLWWAGPLVLAALPVWFLHSRTSFETTAMVSFYACFLCAYLLYRYHNPRYVIAAIMFGAATFYSYTNGQGVMLVSSALLLISDLRYHLRVLREKPRLLGAALIATLLVAAQYIRFRMILPDAFAEHLRVMDSIWLKDVPLSDKISSFAQNYLLGLSPGFWFAPMNGVDLDRHTFKGWGNLPLIFAPLLLIGLLVCLRQWRSSAHRAVLIAILAAPFSASLAVIHNYRVLAMVIPAALLVSLGIESVANWLKTRRVPLIVPALVCAAWLTSTNITMLRVALADGPTWYTEYTMGGMQYGASQLFPIIAADLRANPQADVIMSPDWANYPNAFVPFFLDDDLRSRVTFLSPDQYLTLKRDIKPTTVFVLPDNQLKQIQASGKMIVDPPLHEIAYPNGKPGFAFVHLRYVDDIEQILARELEQRSKLIDDTAQLDGQSIRIAHSLTDLGAAADLFDNDKQTLMRGVDANPLVFDMEFSSPRDIRAIGLDFYRIDLGLTIMLWAGDSDRPQTFTTSFRGVQENPHIDYSLPGGPLRVRRLRIELLDLNAAGTARIHVQELQLR